MTSLITVSFLKDGVPDRTIPVRYFKTVAEVEKRAIEFRKSPLHATHQMHVGGDMSVEDERFLLDAGIIEPAGAHLPKVSAKLR
jgi:hypothetical protein